MIVASASTIQEVKGQPGIVTPEAVVLDFERAGVASRILAISLDILILGVSWAVLFVGAVQIAGQLEGAVGAVLAVFFSFGGYLAYFAGFETAMQRTPGKAAFGLRVVSADGTPVRFQQAFLRGVIGLVEFLLVPFGFVAVVVALLTPRDQRTGDLAAGTLVVRQRTATSFVAPAQFPPPPGYEGYAASLDIGAMKTAHYELVRRFLLRAHELTPPARGHVAVKLANPLAGMLNHTPPPNLHPEVFLVCVAGAWQQAHGNPAWQQRPGGYPSPQPQPWGGPPGPPAPSGAPVPPAPSPGLFPPPPDLPTLPPPTPRPRP